MSGSSRTSSAAGSASAWVRAGARVAAEADHRRRAVSMLDVSIRIGFLNLMSSCASVRACSSTSRMTSRARATSPTACSSCTRASGRGGPDRGGAPDCPSTVHQLLVSAVPTLAPLGLGRTGRRRASEGRRPEGGVPLPAALPVRDRELRDETPPLRELGPAAFVARHAFSPRCASSRRRRRRCSSTCTFLLRWAAPGAERKWTTVRLVAHGSSDAAVPYGGLRLRPAPWSLRSATRSR